MSNSSSPRTKVRRHPERADYRRSMIDAILDEGLICHMGFVDEGVPWVVPTMYARAGDLLYIHGSPASRMLRGASAGQEICITVTLLDGVVLARSVFHHSMNYRSVMLVGAPHDVTDTTEKMTAFRALVDHVIPGRWEDSRHPTLKELRATRVLRLNIEEASCKLRQGPPADALVDLELPHWAGVIPTSLVPQRPVAAPDLRPGIPAPDYVLRYRRPEAACEKDPQRTPTAARTPGQTGGRD
ncbi:MAG: pyridoxamine 5'-phosphate oxidase family protein [Candidatus Dormibacteria bacterium]